jgi:hypothetical protein
MTDAIAKVCPPENDAPADNALPWEKLSFALRALLGADGDALVTRAEVRQAEDALWKSEHDLKPYELQFQALVNVLVARGVLDAAELEARMSALAAKLTGDMDYTGPMPKEPA